jgi:zinc protease
MGLKVFCLVGVWLLFANGASAAQKSQEFKFENGLKLIVQEDHRSPVAVVQTWYRVGSSYEYDGITGVSHALEHMMFKGTPTYPDGMFSKIVSSRGGLENAFTSFDYTAYYQQWAATNIEKSFELESDRMKNLTLNSEEFSKEINVVLEERRLRTDDNPQALASEIARATTFQTSPYRYPIIGWEADIKGMSVDDLTDWYVKWYSPNNATLVVVGDVVAEEVYNLAKKHFGKLSRVPLPAQKKRPEVAQKGLKRVSVLSDKARVPFVILSYKAPSLPYALESGGSLAEVYALDVLCEILDGDLSSRLQAHLVRGKEVASHVFVRYSPTARLETALTVTAIPRDGVDLETLEKYLIEEINLLSVNPPTDEELERVKTQVAASRVYSQDSMASQATMIGSFDSVGLDWRLKDTYLQEINAVSSAGIVAAAQKHLRKEALTITYLMPEQDL